MSLLLLVLRLWLLHKMVGYDARLYVRTVLWRILLVTLIVVPVAYVVRAQMSDGWQTLIASSLLSVVIMVVTVYAVGITQSERAIVNDKVKLLIARWKK